MPGRPHALVAALVALSSFATSSTAQGLRIATPRFYNAAAGGWNGSSQHVWHGGPVQPDARTFTARADETIRGALTAPDGTAWYHLVRNVDHTTHEGHVVHVSVDGSERRYGPLWSAEVPSGRFTGSMAMHGDGRVFVATPSRIRYLSPSQYVLENAEIFVIDPADRTATMLVAGPDLAPFVSGFHDGDVFGLHWRASEASSSGFELVFGLNLMGNPSRMDLLGWTPDGGLRRIRELATLPDGITHYDHNPPALAAHGDDLYFVTPMVVRFVHGVPPEPARLLHLDLETGATTEVDRIPFDPASTLRGFQGLTTTHDGQVYYGRRHDLGVNAPVTYDLVRYDQGGAQTSFGQVAALPNHSGVPYSSRFVLSVFVSSPRGAADVDLDFELSLDDVKQFARLYEAKHARADLDGDLDVDPEDAVAFLESWLGMK